MDAMRRRLTVRRIALGLSQQEIADRMGAAQTAVSRLESGSTASPGLSTLTRWAKALDLKLTVSLEDPWDSTYDPEKEGA